MYNTKEDISQEDLYMCIGMEALLTPQLNSLVRERKRQHVATIMAAQARQGTRGIVDVEELAKLSEQSSEWTTNRAQKLAEGYWDCLGEQQQSQAPS